MESNSLITFASIEEYKESLIDKNEKWEPGLECCIYRVPKAIRKTNEEAYIPQVISIGPLHHDNPELAYMEKQKIRSKRKFSERITHEIWQEFVSFIQNNEQCIRNCYEETSNLQKLEFVTMILYDAVFIIELFLKYFERVTAGIALPYTRRLMPDIMMDLILLENQLPYFVLEGLYTFAFPYQNVSFLYLSCLFFESFINISDGEPNILRHVDIQLKHFTDLKRYLLTMRFLRPKSKGDPSDLPCALKLQESGLKFKPVKEEYLLNITFKKKRLLMIPWLEVNELQIPLFKIDDATENLFRNLMALELCHYPKETYVCQYICLMDALINTTEDVNLLAEAGIISNHVGNVKVAHMFNKLCENMHLDGSSYCDIFKELKAHYYSPWNHAVATLKRFYFNNLWRSTGTVAAVLFLILTFIQTICSVLQVI